MKNKESTFALEVGAGAASIAIAVAMLWLVGRIFGNGAALGLCKAMSSGECDAGMTEALRVSTFWAPLTSGLVWALLGLMVAAGALISIIALAGVGREVRSLWPSNEVQ
jgi:hypothetical protein